MRDRHPPTPGVEIVRNPTKTIKGGTVILAPVPLDRHKDALERIAAVARLKAEEDRLAAELAEQKAREKQAQKDADKRKKQVEQAREKYEAKLKQEAEEARAALEAMKIKERLDLVAPGAPHPEMPTIRDLVGEERLAQLIKRVLDREQRKIEKRIKEQNRLKQESLKRHLARVEAAAKKAEEERRQKQERVETYYLRQRVEEMPLEELAASWVQQRLYVRIAYHVRVGKPLSPEQVEERRLGFVQKLDAYLDASPTYLYDWKLAAILKNREMANAHYAKIKADRERYEAELVLRRERARRKRAKDRAGEVAHD